MTICCEKMFQKTAEKMLNHFLSGLCNLPACLLHLHGRLLSSEGLSEVVTLLDPPVYHLFSDDFEDFRAQSYKCSEFEQINSPKALSNACLGGHFGPKQKCFAPPSQIPRRHPPGPSALPPPPLSWETPPPGIFNKKLTPATPLLAPRTPFPSPEQKNKKYRNVHQVGNATHKTAAGANKSTKNTQSRFPCNLSQLQA